MKNDVENPWSVNNLEEFLYFCCPECDERNQFKDQFLQHALNQHPKAKECLQNIKIKKEVRNAEEEILDNLELPSMKTIVHENNTTSHLSYHTDYVNCNIVKCENNEEIYEKEIQAYESKSSMLDKQSDSEMIENDESSLLAIDDNENEAVDPLETFGQLGNTVKSHIKDIHKITTNYKCDLCDKDFSRPSGLTLHIKNVHKGLKNYKCHICGKGFSQSGQIKIHINLSLIHI